MSEERVRLPIVCRKLRTKTGFGTLEGLARDWREGASSTAVFWCLRTMETWGTDQQPAHASACRQGRECFASPEGQDVA
ncbi:MAG TPA: hypothetical protein VIF15_15030 [Polyangiaceae bacterium]|jgi:hypothetical protein